MGISKKEMIQMLRQMGDRKQAIAFFKRRNAEIRAELNDISAASPRIGDACGGGEKDSIGRQAIRREELEKKIEINERAIEWRLREYAALARMMTEALEKKEREVIWARHGEWLPWDRVAQKTYISRSQCFRLEAAGLEKLCRAWDKHLEKKEEKKVKTDEEI